MFCYLTRHSSIMPRAQVVFCWYLFLYYILNPKGDSRVKDCVFFMCYITVSLGSSVFLGLHELALCPISKSQNYWTEAHCNTKRAQNPKSITAQDRHESPNFLTTQNGIYSPKIYCFTHWAQEPTFFHLMGRAWSPWCSSSKPKALIYTKQTLVGKNLTKKIKWAI